MKKLILNILVLTILGFTTISCEQEYRCSAGDPNISGARCNDGTSTDATGQGACSHHGGIDYWLCCCE